ncbi:MAG: hypothetical protein Q8K96_15790 [Rubrivivax sp.]|nr:hypothetical protein [Rubrivivax sp.]
MMTPAARSLHIFGLYLIGAGCLLMLVPALLLAPLGLPAPADAWGHVAGMLAAFLGIYYLLGARAELLSFMRASVWVRLSVIVILGAFVAAGLAPLPLLAFGVIDLAAAAWTWLALRSMGAAVALRAA